MDPNNKEVAHEFPPFFRLYKDGTIDRFLGTEIIPPTIDSFTGVQSKDITISPQTGISARLFLPKTTSFTPKLPLLIYIHGGAFCIESPFSPVYHNHVSSVAAEANVVAVSIHYRRAPEHPLPIAYDDTWASVQWVASHIKGKGPETWLNDHVDFERVFLAGDSAGANLAHNTARRAAVDVLGEVKIVGMVLIHPYFGNDQRSKLPQTFPTKLLDSLSFISSDTSSSMTISELSPSSSLSLFHLSSSSFILSAAATPPSTGLHRLKMLANRLPSSVLPPCTTLRKFLTPKCATTNSVITNSTVLVLVVEKDGIKDRGWTYFETLRKSGWSGAVDVVETEGEDHVFHLFNPNSENAASLLKQMASFFNQN
ncbi:hypothetical protein I3843_05G048000 [Carya illinoinensis]|uniref:Alpha/beta hydrolase fold-3 domain-containing protein n=1 Tax=Carya illinoinensis TaxID=32201 RepID=A0A922JNJ5_CARIL|nr:hypothetical protein I3842_05G053400 [Carya illinoinensis]KAG7977777.1 hypothetical protein I3843_05G048000 [Carya illinoinensis]